MDNKQQITVDINQAGSRLDKFLAKNGFGFSLSQKLLRQKDVKVNSKKAGADYRLNEGDIVEVYTTQKLSAAPKSKPKISEEKVELIKKSIIYKDDNLLAIDKPSGIAVQAGDPKDFSIDAALSHLKLEKIETPRLVHRIDRDTSGILLLARNRQTAELLTESFRNKTINKTYLALVVGSLSKKEGKIDMPLEEKAFENYKKVFKSENGKPAVTLYKVLKEFAGCSLVELKPITGRMHQLRVHLKEIGHPIVGDRKYGRNNKEFGENRLCLHSFKVEIADFFGKKLEIETKKPEFL